MVKMRPWNYFAEVLREKDCNKFRNVGLELLAFRKKEIA
jgi:hypothetical protein